MTPLQFIRHEVFRCTQATMAGIARVTQSTVSKWERGICEPNRDEMHRIREEAIGRGIRWRDEWFFTVPLTVTAAQPAPETARASL